MSIVDCVLLILILRDGLREKLYRRPVNLAPPSQAEIRSHFVRAPAHPLLPVIEDVEAEGLRSVPLQETAYTSIQYARLQFFANIIL